MKIDLKAKLNSEFDKLVPDVSEKVKETQICVCNVDQRTKRLSWRFAFTTVVMMMIMVFSAFLSINYKKKPSVVTCVIVSVPTEIQLVIANENVVTYEALDFDGVKILNEVGNIKGVSMEEAVNKIIEASYKLDYINATETVKLMAINNEESHASHYLECLKKSTQTCAITYNINVKEDALDFYEYNKLVFDGENKVDNLDEDINAIISASYEK